MSASKATEIICELLESHRSGFTSTERAAIFLKLMACKPASELQLDSTSSVYRYIKLPIKEALDLKYADGVLSHRNSTEFDGDPMEELFQEMLDSMHYCDELKKRGIDYEHRRRQFLSTALETQTLWRNSKKN
jgi:hypothetical protein